MAKGFSDTVEAWVETQKAVMLDTFKEAFIEIGERVIDRTPIDTGRAQGSWVSAKNEIASGPAPHRDPETAKAKLRLVADALTLGDMASLASNLEYIRVLEFGRSDQAPAGMVRLTAQQWEQIASEAAAKAREKHGLR